MSRNHYPEKLAIVGGDIPPPVQPLTNPDHQFLTERQTAELLSCSRQTLSNQRHEGRGLPFYRFGGAIRYKLKEILEFMDAGRVVHSKDGSEK